MMILCEGVRSWTLRSEEAGDFTLGEAEIADLFAGRDVTVRSDAGAYVTVHPDRRDEALNRHATVAISATVAWGPPPRPSSRALAGALRQQVDCALRLGRDPVEIVVDVDARPGAPDADRQLVGPYVIRMHPADLAALLQEAQHDLGAPRAAVPNLLRVWGIPIRCGFVPYPIAEPPSAMPAVWDGDGA